MKFIDTLLNSYENSILIIKKKVRILTTIDLVLAGFAFVYAILAIVVTKVLLDAAIFFPVSLLLVGNLFIIKSGRFYFASNFIIILAFAALGVSVFTTEKIEPLLTHNMLSLMVFVILFSCLVGNKTYQILMVSIGALIMQYALFLLMIIPLEQYPMEEKVGPMVVATLILILSSILAILLNNLFNNLVKEVSNEKFESQEMYNRLEHTVSTFQGNMEIGNILTDAAESTAIIVGDMEREVKDISMKADSLHQETEKTKTNNTRLVEKSVEVKNLFSGQASSVTETSTALEQISANIASVSNVAAVNADRSRKLESFSTERKVDIEKERQAIVKLIDSTKDIIEISSVIESIAQQTNLLGMNAAIQAAHAGDHGKGFAVVAGEIRKLSEMTSENSRKITETITKISTEIENASETNEKAIEAFDTIVSKIADTAGAMREIEQAMREVSTGISEISKSALELRDSAEKGSVALTEIDELIAGNNIEFTNISEIVQDMNKKTNAIARQFSEIITNTEKVNEIGTKNKESLQQLGNEITKISKSASQQ